MLALEFAFIIRFSRRVVGEACLVGLDLGYHKGSQHNFGRRFGIAELLRCWVLPSRCLSWLLVGSLPHLRACSPTCWFASLVGGFWCGRLCAPVNRTCDVIATVACDDRVSFSFFSICLFDRLVLSVILPRKAETRRSPSHWLRTDPNFN